jgi:hypothetical protein
LKNSDSSGQIIWSGTLAKFPNHLWARNANKKNEKDWPPIYSERHSIWIVFESLERRGAMNLSHLPHEPLVALIAGILILIMPRLLNYVIALYLIIIGVLGLTHGFR